MIALYRMANKPEPPEVICVSAVHTDRTMVAPPIEPTSYRREAGTQVLHVVVPDVVLDLAHRALDEAVFAAYGWDPAMSDEGILEKLLEFNLARSGA